jgi:hypothetical protein
VGVGPSLTAGVPSLRRDARLASFVLLALLGQRSRRECPEGLAAFEVHVETARRDVPPRRCRHGLHEPIGVAATSGLAGFVIPRSAVTIDTR